MKANQNSATYKKDIVIEFIEKYPKASTMALARMIYKDYPLDFNSAESVRSNVRRYRGEIGVNNSSLTTHLRRDEQTKKQFMRKKIDLPESDYEKCEPFIIPKGQNRILVLSDIHFPYQDNKALELALNYGLQKKANAVYLNGDILDFYQCSRFTKDRRLRDMASVPKCGLCRLTQPVEKYFEDKKKNFLVYSIFIVLLVEMFSNVINWYYVPTCKDLYASKIYPILTQFVLFLVFTSVFLWRERLRFCLRKATAVMYLSIYYLFGFISLLFCFTATFYINVVNFTLLVLSLLIFIQSIYAKKYGD